jgi:FKBP-type peptidyl-prolyl cis-trans isomerase
VACDQPGEKLAIRNVKICGGPEVTPGSTVWLLYRVALTADDLNAGRSVESNYNPDVPIMVAVRRDQLLPGVYEALLGMRSGGSVRRVHIPAALAFGDRAVHGVPSGSDLWVDLCVSRVGYPEQEPIDSAR